MGLSLSVASTFPPSLMLGALRVELVLKELYILNQQLIVLIELFPGEEPTSRNPPPLPTSEPGRTALGLCPAQVLQNFAQKAGTEKFRQKSVIW
jgi:hypothetical protein